MPHIIIEYTENIGTEADIESLLVKANQSLLSHGDTFSPHGIRSRAIKITDYAVGEGTGEGAFVHVILQIAAGRTTEVKQSVLEHLFTSIEGYFKEVMPEKHIAISLQLVELNENGNMYIQN